MLLVVIGQTGNSFGMYQVGSPYWVPLVEIGLTLLVLGIASLSWRTPTVANVSAEARGT